MYFSPKQFKTLFAGGLKYSISPYQSSLLQPQSQPQPQPQLNSTSTQLNLNLNLNFNL